MNLKAYAELTKFEHTIFALPFLLSSVVLLVDSFPSLWKLFWILLAFVSARTLGMSLNRLIDLPIDKQNPRTKDWIHARGIISEESIKMLAFLSGALFLFSSAMINFYTFLLAPLVVFLLWFYPYAKRITYYPHLVLGMVYFLIPVAVDIAINESVSKTAFMLGVGMGFWVAGFDVLYSLQDYQFDKSYGLKSIPVKFGIGKAIRIARAFHLITFLFFLGLIFVIDFLGFIYLLGMFLLGGFLLYEHSLVKEHDLSKINKAFFTVNGYISMAYFFTVLLDRLL
ncbi:UbiA-like polyprenyltransferase [Thermocrinis sp.]